MYIQWKLPAGNDSKYHLVARNRQGILSHNKEANLLADRLKTRCGLEIPDDYVDVRSLTGEMHKQLCGRCHVAK